MSHPLRKRLCIAAAIWFAVFFTTVKLSPVYEVFVPHYEVLGSLFEGPVPAKLFQSLDGQLCTFSGRFWTDSKTTPSDSYVLRPNYLGSHGLAKGLKVILPQKLHWNYASDEIRVTGIFHFKESPEIVDSQSEDNRYANSHCYLDAVSIECGFDTFPQNYFNWRDGVRLASGICLLLWIFCRYLIEQRQANRFANGQCIFCGYDITASKNRCPECGHDIEMNKTTCTPTN